MRPERTCCAGSHPWQGYKRTSCNGWDGVLLSMGSLKFRQGEPEGANGEIYARSCFQSCVVKIFKRGFLQGIPSISRSLLLVQATDYFYGRCEVSRTHWLRIMFRDPS